jgi:hypothetical protein
MDRQGFSAASPGTLVPTLGQRNAFVPAPLPPQLDLNPLASAMSEASQAIGELKGIGRSVPNPSLLLRPLQRREAVSSSGMEGTYTTLSDLYLFEAGADDAGRREDNQEVFNYVPRVGRRHCGTRDLANFKSPASQCAPPTPRRGAATPRRND